jgi:hypothetical protein
VSGDGAASNPCVEDLRRWIERMGTGCGFAQALARRALVHYLVVPEGLTPESVRAINAGLDAAAAEKKTAAIVFPELHTSNDIADAVRALRSDPRWSAQWVASETRGPRRFGLLRLAWRTLAANGRETSAMGLAPLRHMPLTRRAPYVAIVLWPGGRENRRAPLPTSPREPVGLINAAHGMDDETYEKHRSGTRIEVKSMLKHDREDTLSMRELLRDVAFRLPLGAIVRCVP